MRIKDLVVATGLSRATVSRHITGEIEPSYEQREKYAKAFKLDFDEFEAAWRESTAPEVAPAPSPPPAPTPDPTAPILNLLCRTLPRGPEAAAILDGLDADQRPVALARAWIDIGEKERERIADDLAPKIPKSAASGGKGMKPLRAAKPRGT